jgi:hypothetical protein
MSVRVSIDRLVPRACTELFAPFGFRGAAPRSGGGVQGMLARPDAHAAGVVEFSGTALTGKLVLASSFGFFAESRPTVAREGVLRMDSSADWLLVRDWSMELANQLLGRIKNQLCAAGVVVVARPPRAVSGHSLLVTLREQKSACQVFGARDHEVLVWFEASQVGAPSAEPGLEPASEGQIIFF